MRCSVASTELGEQTQTHIKIKINNHLIAVVVGNLLKAIDLAFANQSISFMMNANKMR